MCLIKTELHSDMGEQPTGELQKQSASSCDQPLGPCACHWEEAPKLGTLAGLSLQHLHITVLRLSSFLSFFTQLVASVQGADEGSCSRPQGLLM